MQLDKTLALHSLAGYSRRRSQVFVKALGRKRTEPLRAFPAVALYCKAPQDIPPDRATDGVPRGLSRLHQTVDQAANAAPAPIEDVGVDHCRAQIPVPQELLDRPCVVAVLQKM
jgi:hypothetical protein